MEVVILINGDIKQCFLTRFPDPLDVRPFQFSDAIRISLVESHVRPEHVRVHVEGDLAPVINLNPLSERTSKS